MSSKIWFCATCGYEVDTKGRCHLCRQKLIASPLPPLAPGDEDQEVGYRIADWEDWVRGQLILNLVGKQIPHRFEEDDLVVSVDDEERVDTIVADLTAPDPADAFVGGDSGVDVEQSVRTLHDAAKRLRLDPTDMDADAEVAEASPAVFVVDEVAGADADTWAAVGRVTRRLLAALGAEEALEEEIKDQAGVLDVLLRPVVAAAEAAAAGASRAAEAAPIDGDEAPADEGVAVSMAASGGDDGALAEAAANLVSAGADGAGAGAGDEVDDAGEGDAAPILGGGPETSYEVPAWMPEQRALLTVLLEDRAIPFAWDGEDLVVPSADEEVVEALFDRIGGAESDEDDEVRYRALEELFAAVSRLAGDPDDTDRAADVLAAAGAVEGPTPFGFDDGKWLGLRRRTRTLADALEHKADPDVVEAQASGLRDALRELV